MTPERASEPAPLFVTLPDPEILPVMVYAFDLLIIRAALLIMVPAVALLGMIPDTDPEVPPLPRESVPVVMVVAPV